MSEQVHRESRTWKFGVALVAGKVIGRVLGIIVVFISAMVSFASLPYYPIWSVLLIALDIFIIWALATYGAEPEAA